MGTMSRSFVEALKDKYCEDEEDESNFIVSFVYTNRPRKNSGQYGDAELAYLTSVVLSMYKVSHAGIPSEGLTTLCPNITDLDLSSNLIGCWNEVFSIFRSLDNLKFVNLSGNALKDQKKCLPGLSEESFGVENLVLNNTGVSWEDIVMVTTCLPQLKELHASKNDYKDISVSCKSLCQSLPALRILHLTDNQFNRWEKVAQLSKLPHLNTLMLSGNPLSNIHYYFFPEHLDQDDDPQGAEAQPETCEGNKETKVEVQDVVGVIMEELLEDAINITTATTTMTSSSSSSSLPPSPKKCDSQSYDSGMEDCLPNTPRTGSCRERLPSDDNDQCSLADSGYGLPQQQQTGDSIAKQPKSGPSTSAAPEQKLSDISERGGGRITTATVPIPGSSPRNRDLNQREKSGKPNNASPAHSNNGTGKSSPRKNNSGKSSPVELEVTMGVNTDKFAYFKIEWDADDEAIGDEEGDDEEREEEEERKREERVEERLSEMKNGEQDETPSSHLFPNLKVLCVTNTWVGDWSDLESLRSFPKLDALRIKGIPFLENLAMDEKRKLLVASLPNISVLNGSEITVDEREKSERFFVRHFCDNPDPPSWHADLVAKHGNLRPITEIDLGRGFKEFAKLTFLYKGRHLCEQTIRVVDNVGGLRKYCASLVNKSRSLIRLYHLSKCGEVQLEYNLLNQDLLPMSRYDIKDGDEIHIDTSKAHQNFSVQISNSFSHSYHIQNDFH